MRIGDKALLYKAANRGGTPRWRGPARILGIDEAGATVQFQPRTSKVARYCAPKKVEETGVEGAEWNSASDRGRYIDGVPLGDFS